MSKAFAIAIPHDEALDAKDEVAFFQAVKVRLVKFDSTGSGCTNEELETTIRQNASIDWTIKENVKAKLKIAVKRLLRRYEYPPICKCWPLKRC